jgi:Flp pilus assembly pilin Flp
MIAAGKSGDAERLEKSRGIFKALGSTHAAKTALAGQTPKSSVFPVQHKGHSYSTVRDEGRCISMWTISDAIEFARANWKKEEGQTMAEYGVVLAVITIGAIAAFTALSTGIKGSLTRITGYLT